MASKEKRPEQLQLRSVKILTKNFAGINRDTGKAQYVPSFCVALTEKDAKTLAMQGWDIRLSNPDPETGEKIPYLPILVSYKIDNGVWDESDSRNPIVEAHFTDGHVVKHTPNSIKDLDRSRIDICSVAVTPWWSEKKQLWRGYLQLGKFKVIANDPFANDPEWQVAKEDEPLPFN